MRRRQALNQRATENRNSSLSHEDEKKVEQDVQVQKAPVPKATKRRVRTGRARPKKVG